MSEPKLILPLLDGFLVGDPISEHHGVRCCPAMQAQTDEKYIVKIVRVPESGAKLEALLLAGAFSDKDAAVAYFRDLAAGVEKEASTLQELSQLEGFTGYDAWQTEPTEDGEGFEVYLLGKYRPTLERFLSRNPMTHLGAVNMGLDLCSALAVCRRSGQLYVDLKPSNVFITPENEYRIGDLGYIALDSVPYASLPEKYLSAYTAPEVTDAYSALNNTLDIYAVGMVLYQVYNNGLLPQTSAPGKPLPAPEYADSDMAAIILKACDPDPSNRWQDPAQMGQALVNYMQTNTVNDEPIVPPVVPVEIPEEIPEIPVQEDPSTEEILQEVDLALEAVGAGVSQPVAVEEPQAVVAEELPAVVAEEPQLVTDPETVVAEPVVEIEETAVEENPEEAVEEPIVAVPAAEPAVIAEAAVIQTVTEAVAERIEEVAQADELAKMLAQADSLIAHETPEPVVAPDPIDVPIPPRIVLPTEEPVVAEPVEEVQEEAETPLAVAEIPPVTEDFADDENEDEADAPEQEKHGRGLIIALISFIVVASLCIGGWLFYKYEYQQTIHGLTISGVENTLTVTLDCDIDNELLTVICSDAYGNAKRQNVVNGMAVFADLAADTRYKIEVEISGFHMLLGQTSGIYVTDEQTTIDSITAIAGQENGSVILNFTVRGPDSDQWRVYYSAEGEAEKFVACNGHVVTINSLTVGKLYTFRVEPVTELYLVGSNTVTFTASNIVYPENLAISGFTGNAMTVTWTAPAGVASTRWTVRCYNSAGYDKTITVTDTVAVFENLDRSTEYQVEVCAEGMSKGSNISLAANSVTVYDLTADTSNPNLLNLSWLFEGTAPANGWKIVYTVSGMSQSQYVTSNEATAVISPIIPGCEYTITIQTVDGEPVFGGTLIYTAPTAETFAGFNVTAEHIVFSMCKTPNKANWDRDDLKASDYTSTFSVGQSASFSVRLRHEYNTSPTNITTLYVIRDASGAIISANTTTQTWTSMWFGGYGKMTIPVMPEIAGEYTVEIFFNGQYVTTESFTMI